MIATETVHQETAFLSEIFPLTIPQPLNLFCFRVIPEVEREDGNRLSFYFCQKFPNRLVVIWHQNNFWVLTQPNQQVPSLIEWRTALESIQDEVEDFSNCFWQFQEVSFSLVVPSPVFSKLAIQILKTTRPYPFLSPITLSKNGVKVQRDVKFWGETIELRGLSQPALTLTIFSTFLFSNSLDEFYENHPERQNPNNLLINLNVKSLDSGGYGTITQLVEPTPALKQRLIKQATGEISKQALRNVPDGQPLVAVKYSKEKRLYYYAMAALRPCVSVDTASRFGVEWGELLKAAKIKPHQNRWNLLVSYNRKASEVLARYGFQLERVSINSRQHTELFWQPPFELKKTKLLFGGGITGTQDQILTGLSKGGVYSRHSKYSDLSRPIRITALNICDLSFDSFTKILQQRLKNYKFKTEIVPITLSIKNLSGSDAKLEVERAVNTLMNVPPDIVLTSLPQSDRDADNDEGGSLYQLVYSLLLRRQIASQIIYENTLKNSNNYGYILNQVIPGILAKLGNLPFILDEPLEIADYFIGFDVSREVKERLSGTMNACASVRLYGKRGEFIRYQMEDALIEGEEIPYQVLARLLPEDELEGKIILIYRDGLFRGQEVDNLLKRARAIGSKFILVECIKSGVPRLYNQNLPFIEAPEQGLALLLSAYEAVLVSTNVPDNVGLANPLRLKIVDDERSYPADIKQVLETTLKLTLLHHGSLKIPRLPMPVYGSHKIAKLRLKGIYASNKLSGDEQFWH